MLLHQELGPMCEQGPIHCEKTLRMKCLLARAETMPRQTYNTRALAMPLQWRHNEHDGVSIHDCSLNGLFRRRSKKTSKVRVTGLCAANSSVTGEFTAQRASNAENIFIWWRHYAMTIYFLLSCLSSYPRDTKLVVPLNTSVAMEARGTSCWRKTKWKRR